MSLDDRKKRILESIIKDYVETAEPVGSRAIVKKHGLNISAATVRNEMADLEEMGYLEQPHTSAGRIPSEKGFRYYVDWMMEKENLNDAEMEILEKLLNENIRDWSDIVQGVGNFLAQVSNYTSFIIVPSVRSTQFQYLHLIPIQEGQALVLVVTDIGLLLHRKIDVPKGIAPTDLQSVAEVFNRVFQGKKLTEIKRSQLQMLREDLQRRRQVIDKALDAIDNLLEKSSGEKVLISGALNILNEPEFKDLYKLKRILTILEEDDLFKDILPEGISQDVDYRIGKENLSEDIREMSLVFTGYKTGGEMGRMGLIGPVRMEYWKAAGTLDSVRAFIEDLLKKRM
ncbi:MAG TPA: heat-inducible transcriptional repressor HrcA [Syntrophomonas sp.]|nr:heat-inducible transcriptional repressor HrcA [Syntrophomonas sp.]